MLASFEEFARRWLHANLPLPSRALRLANVALRGAIVVGGAAWAISLVRPIVATPEETLPAPAGDARFGLPLETRRAIFRELAADQPSAIAAARDAFPDEPWSQQDHRGAFERETFRAAATRHGISLTAVHLVFDEGVHEKWPGADGKPIDPTIVPLHPRRRW